MKLKAMIAICAILVGAIAMWSLSRRAASANAPEPSGAEQTSIDGNPKAGATGKRVFRRISQIMASRAGAPVKDVPAPAKPEGWEEIPTVVDIAMQHEKLYRAYQLANAKARTESISQKIRACAKKLPKDATVEWESASLFETDGHGNVVLKRQRVLPLDDLDRDPIHAPFFECAKDTAIGMVIPLPNGQLPEGMSDRFELRDSHTANAPLEWPIPADDLRELGEELAELRQLLSPESQREAPSTPEAMLLATAREKRLSCIVEQKRRPAECP